jgi:hypothetical protein
LWIEQSVLQRQLEIKKNLLEEKMEQVVLGGALLADIELDSLRLDDAIIEVKQEILVLEDEEKAIQGQLESMKKRNGNCFWPKPIIHLNAHVNFDSPTFLVIKCCGFCLWGFHCNDIVVISCKHMYHPFCLGELVRVNNKCSICEQFFTQIGCGAKAFVKKMMS